ncbi:activator of Hsp90 ATPase 1 family protein [Prauserella marina]|uniref:Activator of Hsp90 ATPase homolog 1-like protein n=1 Tax=Prauserella marina TaxID=530584 RepID=A0A222VVC4_9PSEU|nr:SRPBCC domain-containing protein [Prauserella marina]ASR37879.1 activator of Hsp90 ATPase 1 family protein [Prauserella marina]PWV73079.1 activator of Hsp90 ATPase-like protein [Prauserella marina]SDD72398.1 Activator of Hsp90 ATPase homolog 1-like protein [Prauserella marina]
MNRHGSRVGLTKDAGWQIGVSKTVHVPVETAWEFLISPEGIAIWLGDGVTVIPERGAGYETTAGVRGETRGFRERDRVRLTWHPPSWTHDTTLQLTVTSAGEGKSRIGVHQERLADAGERELQRKHWKDVIAVIAEALTR